MSSNAYSRWLLFAVLTIAPATWSQAQDGVILSVGPSTFVGGQTKTVWVVVSNTGSSGDVIIRERAMR